MTTQADGYLVERSRSIGVDWSNPFPVPGSGERPRYVAFQMWHLEYKARTEEDDPSRNIWPSIVMVVTISACVATAALSKPFNGVVPLLLGALAFSLAVLRDRGLEVRPAPAPLWPSITIAGASVLLLMMDQASVGTSDHYLFQRICISVYLIALSHILVTDLAAARLTDAVIMTDLMIANVGGFGLGYLLWRSAPAAGLTYLTYLSFGYENNIISHATVFAVFIAMTSFFVEGAKKGFKRWSQRRFR